jgi:drug/metabolite transporter superfamily protein YnfA
MASLRSNLVFALVFVVAALLEVGGDAAMRQNVQGKGIAYLLFGFVLLSGYGFLVNHVPWDFSKLLGVYVAVFAWVGILWGYRFYGDAIPVSTWVGLGVITVGGLIIQFGISIGR